MVMGDALGEALTVGKQGAWAQAVVPFTLTLSRTQRAPKHCLFLFKSRQGLTPLNLSFSLQHGNENRIRKGQFEAFDLATCGHLVWASLQTSQVTRLALEGYEFRTVTDTQICGGYDLVVQGTN